MKFKLSSPFTPTGDQPKAIESLYTNIKNGISKQVLLGVTGSGKTYTIANLIEKLQWPTLVISHNKTLAAQLYQEFKSFFPKNAVSYFVSYYDYYQPEAYIPQSNTYIEKETEINDEIDKLRLAATTNLLTRKDTIIVSSVSCIYNIGSPKEYGNYVLELRQGVQVNMDSIMSRLIALQYERTTFGSNRGTFRVKGDIIDIFPAYEDFGYRLIIENDLIVKIQKIDSLKGYIEDYKYNIVIYPAKHYITDPKQNHNVFNMIKDDLACQVDYFKKNNRLIEAQRINERVNYDLEMIQEFGYVNGIENYSRYFDGRNKGDPPYTLLDYFNEPYHDKWLLVIDESHITIPQIRGMFNGDKSRKATLVDFGFRLPAAMDNRPLKFEEFFRRINNTIFVSATPNDFEISISKQSAYSYKDKPPNTIIEQLVRPTGIVDPQVIIKPTKGQINDLINEIMIRKKNNERVLVTTLTKKIAEDLSIYLNNPENYKEYMDNFNNKIDLPKINYLHSEITTLKRTAILNDLRSGIYDVVVGINLLREGIDLPEVTLVAILDADKEGFLRSKTSLIQTMGRAARNDKSMIIMYADIITKSMLEAIEEIKRRRDYQIKYNKKFKITPKKIIKPLRDNLSDLQISNDKQNYMNIDKIKDYQKVLEIDYEQYIPLEKQRLTVKLTKMMKQAATELNFELASVLRDKIDEIKKSI